MTRAGNDPSGLGRLEAAVLDVLWTSGELTTPEVHELVGRQRQLAYTTILTTLQRLHRKGLLTRTSRGRGHAYAPAQSREEFFGSRASGLASQLLQLGDAGLAAFLAEARRLDPEFVATLRARLEAER